MAKRTAFDHEKLDVYRLAVDFARWVGELLDGPLKDCKGDSVKHLDEPPKAGRGRWISSGHISPRGARPHHPQYPFDNRS